MRGHCDHGIGTCPTAAQAAFARRWALGAALVGVLTGGGCDKAVCDGVEGSCLALHVDGTASYDRLEGVLMAASGTVLKAGDAATAVTLPVAVQILPPPDLSTALAGALKVNGYRGSELAASGLVTLSWPDGAHIEVKLALIELPPADMATPAAPDLGK